MKDLVLVAINAKYSHTNLALRCLQTQLLNTDVELQEFSINDAVHRVLHRLLDSPSKVYGFSCYIWNMAFVLKVTEILKKSLPEAQILLGGPEVSFDAADCLKKYPWIDSIISGEGEIPIKNFMEAYLKPEKNRRDFEKIPGLYFRNSKQEQPIKNQGVPLKTLSFPYEKEALYSLKNRIIYFETMRGCPYHCSYCLSSQKNGVTALSLEAVFKAIDLFLEVGVKQVKLVDRTFNYDIERAKTIFKGIIKRGGETNFHFEMTGDLIDDEMIEILKEAPKGMIQFEIGVQSTKEKTLNAIGRRVDFSCLEKNVKRILEAKNIHVHLDLIAGLPYEGYAVFKKSFNQTIALKPDMLQLGFLKCLKGTRIREEADKHDYTYASFAPYEIIANAYISSQELYKLRDIEVLVDRYYNSGGFSQSLATLFEDEHFDSAFDFFESFFKFWSDQGYYELGKSKEDLYAILMDFLKTLAFDPKIFEMIKFDYLCLGKLYLPNFFKETTPQKEFIFEFLKKPDNLENYLPELKNLAPKKIVTQVKFQTFEKKVLENIPVFSKEELKNHPFEMILLIFYKGEARLAKLF